MTKNRMAAMLALLLSLALAVCVQAVPRGVSSNTSYNYSSSVVSYGIFAMIIGLVLLFFGIRFYRVIIGIAGFLSFGLITYIILYNIHVVHSFGPNRDNIIVWACIATGTIGALAVMWVWQAALVAIGGLGGFGLAIFILTWHKDGTISNQIARPIFIGLLTLIGAHLILLYERTTVIVATSIAGAVLVTTGIDVFAETGFDEAINIFITNRETFALSSGMYLLLVVCAILLVAGLAVQFLVTGKHQTGFTRRF